MAIRFFFAKFKKISKFNTVIIVIEFELPLKINIPHIWISNRIPLAITVHAWIVIHPFFIHEVHVRIFISSFYVLTSILTCTSYVSGVHVWQKQWVTIQAFKVYEILFFI